MAAVSFNCTCDAGKDTRTLAEIRSDLATLLGFDPAVIPTPAQKLLDLFLKNAQQHIYRNFKDFRRDRFFTWQTQQGVRFYGIADNIENGITIPEIATAAKTAGAGSQLPAGKVAYRVSAYNATGETLASEPVYLNVDAGDSVTITWDAVTVPTGVGALVGYRIYGRTEGAEQFIASVPAGTVTWTDDGSVAPNGNLPEQNTTVLRPRRMNPDRVQYVGISQVNGQWRPLVRGIAPELYTMVSSQAPPQRYEIRECIEVWPAPADSSWSIRIKGGYDLLPFNADTDVCTVEDQALLLKAVALGKAHYGTPDAQEAASEFEDYLYHMRQGQHANKRYVPGGAATELPAAIPPVIN